MNPILDTTYLRQYFRIENAVPEEVIQREIDFVRNRFVDYFGTAYTDAEDDAQEETPVNPVLIDKFKVAMSYLSMTRLLTEDYVLTGFGVVIKQDDYSDPLPQDKIDQIAADYVKSASTTLHSIEEIKKKDITGCIENCQSFVNGFFSKKDDCSLYQYFPYNIYW